MKPLFRYLVNFLLIFLIMGFHSPSCSVAGEEPSDESINWFLPAWPPFAIKDGQFKDQGIFNRVYKLYVENMPGYRHKLIYASGKRIFSTIESRSDTCSIGWIKTPERERVAYYSMVHTVAPALNIITTKEKAGQFNPLLDSDSKISLKELLSNKRKLKIGIIEKRSYTMHLDSIIQEHTGQKNIYTRVTGDLGSGLVGMLQADRIDYFIEYPHVVTYEIEENGLALSPQSFDIAEIENSYVYGYTICSKNKFGQQVITEINKIIRKEGPALIKFAEKWYDDQTIQRMRDQGVYQVISQ